MSWAINATPYAPATTANVSRSSSAANPAAGAWKRIESGLVNVNANLTYQDADTLIEQHPTSWGQLLTLADRFRAQRLRSPQAKRAQVRVWRPENQGPLKLIWQQSLTPAMRLVEVLAILYNSFAADYLAQHDLPALYRTQPPGHTVQLSTTPQPHRGVQAKRYVQITSPLRRFPDLLMQRQLVDHLHSGRKYIDQKATLEPWLHPIQTQLARQKRFANRAEQHAKRLYLLQTLRQQPHRHWRALPRERHLLWLPQIQLEAQSNVPLLEQDLPPTDHYLPKDEITVRIDSINLAEESVLVNPIH